MAQEFFVGGLEAGGEAATGAVGMARPTSSKSRPAGDDAWHRPVMLREALEQLDVRPGGFYCDCTLGGGGHAGAILERCAPHGRLLGIDRDPEALERSRHVLAPHGDRLTLAHAAFADLPQLAARLELPALDGILLDLGVSSHQLDSPERGFSFCKDGPLDMRMDPTSGTTAEQLLAAISLEDLIRILAGFGEVQRPGRVARAIRTAMADGTVRGTADLARVVERAAGGRGPRSARIHPATLAFQALRMAVNREVEQIETFLADFVRLLRRGGRIAVISFHSVEDRVVKRALARLQNPCTCPQGLPVCICHRQAEVRVLTPRPLRPDEQECLENPRARSARLRAAYRI